MYSTVNTKYFLLLARIQFEATVFSFCVWSFYFPETEYQKRQRQSIFLLEGLLNVLKVVGNEN